LTPRQRVFAVSVRKLHFNEADCTSYKMDSTSKWFPISDNRRSVNDEADETLEASLNELDDDWGKLCEFALLRAPCIPRSSSRRVNTFNRMSWYTRREWKKVIVISRCGVSISSKM
jgi:hypothetical protein